MLLLVSTVRRPWLDLFLINVKLLVIVPLVDLKVLIVANLDLQVLGWLNFNMLLLNGVGPNFVFIPILICVQIKY